MTTPAQFQLLGVSIVSARAEACLSSELEARMPSILGRVLDELGRDPPEN